MTSLLASPTSSPPRAIKPAVRGAPPNVIGRYVAMRLLGQGAMGRVLLARDTVLGREVAIKLLRDDLGLPPEIRDELLVRMRHEAQAAARVSHPNLVTLHDMGDDPERGVYLVFEYVPGRTLRDAVERDGPLSPQAISRLARELGSALDAAHAAGVLHRDIKPENIMLAPHGAKIADFGIARIPDSTLTRTGGLVGTPAYCAPEALSTGVFSPASDQFSLAATLYEAIFGERAFPGEDALTVAARIANEPPAPLAARHELDPRVDEALLRAMAVDPAARFPSCAVFTEALVEALGGAASLPIHAPAPPSRRRALLGALTLGAIGVVLVATLMRGNPAPAAAPIVLPSPIPTSAAKAPPAPPPKPTQPARVRQQRAPVEEADESEVEADAAPLPSTSSLPPLPPPFADPFAPKPASSQSPPAPGSLIPPLGRMLQRDDSDSQILAP